MIEGDSLGLPARLKPARKTVRGGDQAIAMFMLRKSDCRSFQ